MNILVKYKTSIPNPTYRYGDLDKQSRIEVSGYGRMIEHDFSSGLVLVVDVENGSLVTTYRTSITVTDPELVGGL
jgi:hypothetical protein